jgi:hypothetical protein
MSNRWVTLALIACLATSILNIVILVSQLTHSPRPVKVPGMTAKDWASDPQFKRAVEKIADEVVEGKDYLDRSEVESLIESCGVRSGKISC